VAGEITMFLLASVVALGLIGSVVVILGLVLAAGLPMGRGVEAPRPAAPPRRAEAPIFFNWQSPDVPVSDEVILRRIEHHLRREALIAEQFIQNPTSEALHASEEQVRLHQ
jgi:hypothetical protein